MTRQLTKSPSYRKLVFCQPDLVFENIGHDDFIPRYLVVNLYLAKVT